MRNAFTPFTKVTDMPSTACLSRWFRDTVVYALMAGLTWPVLAVTPLNDQPVLATVSVPGNLALPLSVEFPTVVSQAYFGAYAPANEFIGYFDPRKCYRYTNVAADDGLPSASNTVSQFYPVALADGAAGISRTCSRAGVDDTWSGNFLNWATMQTIDPFRWALTGGYRRVDTATLTVLERGWASGQGGTGNFERRTIFDAAIIAGATPFTWGRLDLRVEGLGNRLRFTNVSAAALDNDGASIAYDGTATATPPAGAALDARVRVRVCDSSALATVPLEGNCVGYGAQTNGVSAGYKPEGLIQQYATRMTYSVFGYLNDSNILRDGGVLRAQQKFVGPVAQRPVLPLAYRTEDTPEWDSATGVLFANPNPVDATATQTALAPNVTIANSGVINYINKFAQTMPNRDGATPNNDMKSFDPVGELYYAAIRYYRNLANVPQWSTMAGASDFTRRQWADGFPVITAWNDPIRYSCQRNFILGIGDVNTHADKNVPGATGTANEPAKPPLVTADTALDSVLWTNRIGTMEGLGTLGTAENIGGCCSNNSATMAGTAYWANTNDIRPDVVGQANTIGNQTVQTYWVDVLEYRTYKHRNQFWLAAKYGGFTPPTGFDPATRTADLAAGLWQGNGRTFAGTATQPLPDNYFPAANADDMVAGLRGAFDRIASQITARTTSFATATPQVAQSGSASYSAQYDANTWTGDLIASSVTFPDNANPTLTENWRLSARLAAQLGGTGWDTNRRIASWSNGGGVAFRATAVGGAGRLSDAQLAALDTPYRAGNDSTDFLNYLRGSRANERTATAVSATLAYRQRVGLLGDIVGSKARPVGPPASGFSNASNPGYAAFRTANAGRRTVVYFGANDGMLHAIDGSIAVADINIDRELFAYVPSAVIAGPNGTPAVDGLVALGNPDFTHRYFVNATPNVFDVDLNRTAPAGGLPLVGTPTPNWASVLIGGLGKGGRSYYALNVTDPATITSEAVLASRVLWEFSHPNLGFSFGDPVVVKTRQHGWVVILPSGHNNANGQGYFLIVNPRTGELIQAVGTGEGTVANDAGLAYVTAFSLDRTDGTADAVYAGDMLGNLWRLDLTTLTGGYGAPVKIAQFTSATGVAQPVTSAPAVEVDPLTGRRFVMVGTGRLLASSDLASAAAQTFYAVIDGTSARFNRAADLPPGVVFPLSRTNALQANTNTVTGVTLAAASMGWYIDLGLGPAGTGWRVVNAPTTFLGRVNFAAIAPGGDACNPSGASRVYSVGYGSGASELLGAGTDPPVIPYSEALAGVVTDLATLSVGSSPRLIGGTDGQSTTGVPGANQLTNLRTRPVVPPGLRRLNWRELPLLQ